MDRCCLSLLILSQLIFCVGTSSTTDAAETQPLTIKEINQTWQQRRERLQAMRIELSQEIVTSKLPYMKSTFDDEDVILTAEEIRRYLNEKVKFRMRSSLLLDSPRFCYRSWGRRPALQLTGMHNQDMTWTTDGQTAACSYQFQGTTHITIFKDPADLMIFKMSNLGPLRWSLLAGDPFSETALDGFSPQPRTEQIQGINCTVLEKTDEFGLHRLWIAPRDQECVVMKYERLKSDRIFIAYQFHYSDNTESGPLPKAWDVKQYHYYKNHNHLSYDCKIKVTSLKSNVTIPTEQFEMTLPPGARVTDLRKRNPKGGELNYIVKDD